MTTDQVAFDTARVIAENIKFYQSIKPKSTTPNSYTVIATLNDANTSQLLALATGTQASLKKYENDIEDCHAESLVKRAYKRYVLDRLLSVLNDSSKSSSSSVKIRLSQAIEQINQHELVLFISQFPCGLISRFQGQEPIDEKTGSVMKRKPGRGQMMGGKVVYVQRDPCLDKIKRWVSTYGFQGKSLTEKLGVDSKLTRLIIGDCEPDSMLDYRSQLDSLSHELAACRTRIKFELAHMRQGEFIYESSDKQPLPVATVWWAPAGQSKSSRDTLEYVVDGRRLGITKNQCTSNNSDYKLRSSDFWLHEHLNRIHEAT